MPLEDGIFKLLRSPGIDSTESNQCSLEGRYDKPILTRFLAPIDCTKITVPNMQICGWDLAQLWMRSSRVWMTSSRVADEIQPRCGWDLAECEWDLAEWLQRLNPKVATILGSIPASSDTEEYEGRQMKQCWITQIKNKLSKKFPPLNMQMERAVTFLFWRYLTALAPFLT